MEAIGLVASIITLISAATLAGSALDRVWGLKGVPFYILPALNEVNDFKASLTFLQTTLSNGQHVISAAAEVEIDRLLVRAHECMRTFNEYLKEKVLREGELTTDNKTPKLRKRAKFREVIGQARCPIDAQRQELASIRHSLSLTLAMINL